jgi:hypothetical protein
MCLDPWLSLSAAKNSEFLRHQEDVFRVIQELRAQKVHHIRAYISEYEKILPIEKQEIIDKYDLLSTSVSRKFFERIQNKIPSAPLIDAFHICKELPSHMTMIEKELKEAGAVLLKRAEAGETSMNKLSEEEAVNTMTLSWIGGACIFFLLSLSDGEPGFVAFLMAFFGAGFGWLAGLLILFLREAWRDRKIAAEVTESSSKYKTEANTLLKNL